jgi:hypothetical protein
MLRAVSSLGLSRNPFVIFFQIWGPLKSTPDFPDLGKSGEKFAKSGQKSGLFSC